MPAPPLSRDVAQAAVDAWRAAGGNVTLAADALGLRRGTMQSRLDIAARYGLMLDHGPAMPGFEVARVTTTEGADGSLKGRSIVQRPEAGGPFSVPEGHRVKGVSVLLDEAGRERARWVKTREGEPDPEWLAIRIKEALADIPAIPAIPPPATSDEDLCAVYLAADFHVGALAWGDETGRNWDVSIARDVILKASGRLIESTPQAKQAIVLGLGDLLHSDGYAPVTPTSKHSLDVDGRYPRVLRVATQILVRMISAALERHDQVLVRILPGNHDPQSAIAVSLALGMYYADNPRVTVDENPSYFWWWRWGTSLLGATHGDAAKMKDLPLIMASRCAEDWGQTKFRYVYTGHIHTQTAIEISGVTVESFQTPTALDAWHHKQGYGANRSMTSITIHKEHGEIARNKVNIV